MSGWVWLGLVVGALAGLFWAPLELRLSYQQQNMLIRTRVTLRVALVVRVSRSFPLFQNKAKLAKATATHSSDPEPPSSDKIGNILKRGALHVERFRILLPALRRVGRSFTVQSFSWETVIGTSNAADTGYLCGLAWSIQGSAAALATAFLSFSEPPRFEVVPNYSEAQFSTSLSCIAKTTVGKAIYTGLRLLLSLKMGDAHGRTPDSVTDANRHGKS